MYRLGKAAYSQGYPGFESLSLRQLFKIYSLDTWLPVGLPESVKYRYSLTNDAVDGVVIYDEVDPICGILSPAQGIAR